MSQQPYDYQQDPRSSQGSSSSSYPYSTPVASHTEGDGRYPIDGRYPPPRYSHQTHTHWPINLAYPYSYYPPMPPPMPPPPSSPANFPAYPAYNRYGQVPNLNYGYQTPVALPLPSSANPQFPQAPSAPPPISYPSESLPLVRYYNARSGPSTRNLNDTQEAVSASQQTANPNTDPHLSRPRYGEVRKIPPFKEPSSNSNEQQGKKILYMPHMLFKSKGVRPFLQASDAPLPRDRRGWSQFPFPDDHIPEEWINRGNLKNTLLPTLHEAAEGMSKGVTTTPTSIKTLYRSNSECRELRQCDELWASVRAYVQPSTRIQTASSSTLNTSYQRLTTWDSATLFNNMATAEGQGRAVTQLRSWFEQLGYSDGKSINTERRLEDVVFDHITKPLNKLLQTRYRPLEADLNNKPSRDRYPCWSRTNASVHQKKLYTEKGNTSHAGDPDFGMYPIKGLKVCCNVMEIKTWASYTNKVINNIFTDAVAPHGNFYWGGNIRVPDEYDTSFTLVRQIWGELVVCDADFGICSNGKVAFLYIRTDINQLTCSTVEKINSPGVLEALFGFTCASIDAFLAQNTEQNRAIINLLAPSDKRHSKWIPNPGT